MKKICIVGAGAVGAYFGAYLTKAGVETVLVDAWPEHVEAMRVNGLTVTEMHGERLQTPVRALHVGDVPQLVKEAPIDVAFIAVKSYDTCWASQLILPYLSSDACLVSLQNSINEPAIASVAGWHRTLGCSVGLLAAELVAPGQVCRYSPRGDDSKIGMRVGEVHGRTTPRVQRIADFLRCADSVKITSNLWGERWSKLTINAMRNGVSAITGMSGKQRDTHEAARDLSIRLGSSSVRVGQALGLALEPVSGLDLDMLATVETDAAAMATIIDMILAVADTRSDAQRPSMSQDIRKGRRTETDHINGLVARKGGKTGIDVCYHHRINVLMKRIEKGEIMPSPALLTQVIHNSGEGIQA